RNRAPARELGAQLAPRTRDPRPGMPTAAMKLPDPPPDSGFAADVDEHERPRLSWTTRPCYPVAIVFVAVLGGAFIYAARWVVDDCRAWAGNAPGPFQPGNLVGHLLFAFFLGLMFVAL